jgi:hypothetical protein
MNDDNLKDISSISFLMQDTPTTSSVGHTRWWPKIDVITTQGWYWIRRLDMSIDPFIDYISINNSKALTEIINYDGDWEGEPVDLDKVEVYGPLNVPNSLEDQAHIEKHLADIYRRGLDQIKRATEEVTDKLYCQALPHLTIDVHTNSRNQARNAIEQFLLGKKPEGFDFPWESPYICGRLYEVNKEKIENTLIKHLTEENKNLRESLMRSRY